MSFGNPTAPVRRLSEGGAIEGTRRGVKLHNLRAPPNHRFDAFAAESRAARQWGSSALRHRSLIVLFCAGAALATPVVPANAQTKLEARYTASLAGIPLGTGSWVIDLAPDQYTAVASGRTTGLVRLISDGHGSSGARGVISGASLSPTTYASSTVSDRRSDDVRMTLRAGIVKDVSAEPQWPPSPDRVPVTDAHRKGVTDPMSAAIMPVAGSGEVLTPDACKRKLAIFDGRQRADIDLVFKRMDRVHADKGYQGPVVVCTLLYKPIAGHRPERPAIKYLVETREMEMWLAPISGTRLLVPFRFSVPTPFGLGVLQATYFVAQPTRAAATPAKATQ
jgi:uncharacterized protein DUF3108